MFDERQRMRFVLGMPHGTVIHTINKEMLRFILMVLLIRRLCLILCHQIILNIPNINRTLNILTDQPIRMNIILTMVMVLLMQHPMSMQIPTVNDLDTFAQQFRCSRLSSLWWR